MKKIIIILCVLATCLSFEACKKDSPGDVPPFTNILPQYVQLAGDQDLDNVHKNGTAEINFEVREGSPQDITITYNISGAFTASNKTVVLTKFTLNALASVEIPNVTGTATVTLVKATKTDGTVLTLGQDNVPANQTLDFDIKP